MKAENTINCTAITVKDEELLMNVRNTYIRSFPESERRDFDLIKNLLRENPYFNMHVLLKNDLYAGFITSWEFPEFVYVEHFAIDESARNGGIGGKAMQHFLKKSTLPVVLEVELPEDEMSRRRIGFYERLGFRLDSRPYRQPPYGPGLPWLDLCLMYYGPIDLDKSFETVKQQLYKHVYGVES